MDLDIHVEINLFCISYDIMILIVYHDATFLPESWKEMGPKRENSNFREPSLDFGMTFNPKEVTKHLRLEGIFCPEFSRLPFGKLR